MEAPTSAPRLSQQAAKTAATSGFMEPSYPDILLPRMSEEEARNAALRGSLMDAQASDPKDHAALIHTGRALGVPTDIIMPIRKEAEQAAFIQSLNVPEMQSRYPKTSEYLSNPDAAKVSRDDIKNLMQMEDHIRSSADIENTGIFQKETREGIIKWLESEGVNVNIGTKDAMDQLRPSSEIEWLSKKTDSDLKTLQYQAQAFGYGGSMAPAAAGSELTPEKMAQVKKEKNTLRLPSDPKGFVETASEKIASGQFLPFVSATQDLVQVLDIRGIGKRAETDTMTKDDWMTLIKMDSEVRRGTKIGSNVASILVGMPAFAGEMMLFSKPATMVGSLAAKGAQKVSMAAIRTVLAKKFTTETEKAVAKHMLYRGAVESANLLGQAAVGAALGGSVRVAMRTYEQMLPQFNKLTPDQLRIEEGKLEATFQASEKEFMEAFMRAYGEQVIEYGTEQLGIHVGSFYGYLGNKTGISKLQAAIAARWFKLNPTSSVSQFSKQLAKYRWDGVLEEWTEEKIASLIQMSLGWEEWGVSFEGNVSELIAFSVIGGLGFASNIRQSRRDAARATAIAQNQVEHFAGLGSISSENVTRTLVPGLQALQADLAASDGPVTDIYFPAESWDKYWESKGTTGRAAAIELGVPEDVYDSASSLKHDFSIPLGTYVEKIAPTEHNAEVSRFARLGENKPTINELEAIAQHNLTVHDEAVTLAQSKAEAEQEKKDLNEESAAYGAKLAELTARIGALLPERVHNRLALDAAVLSGAPVDELIHTVTSLDKLGEELQRELDSIPEKVNEILVKTEEINKRLTEIRQHERAMSQAAIAGASETKDLADAIYAELLPSFVRTNSKGESVPTLSESAIRLKAALAARIVANLSEKSGMSISDFMERFALKLSSSGAFIPVNRARLSQSAIKRMDSDYLEAVKLGDLAEAQRIINEAAALVGEIGEQAPVIIGEGNLPIPPSVRYPKAGSEMAKRQERLARESFQPFVYSMEMMVGNNTGSPLAPLINAPLWVKRQFDAEMREAYLAPGTRVDILASAFGLSRSEEGDLIEPSAYINENGDIEINPSGQIDLTPSVPAEAGIKGFAKSFKINREVLKGETWRSIVENALFWNLTAQRESLQALEAELKGTKDKVKGKHIKKQIKKAKAEIAQTLENLESKINSAIRAILKENKVEEVDGKYPEPTAGSTITFTTSVRNRVYAYALAHGILQQQEAISGHLPIKMEETESAMDASGFAVVVGRPLNEDEIKQVLVTAKDIFGVDAPAIGYFPTSLGYKIINFGLDQTRFLTLISELHKGNLVPGEVESVTYFKTNGDYNFYERNDPTGDGSSIRRFEKKLRQSGFWALFNHARTGIEPRLSSVTDLWKERLSRADKAGGISDDAAWKQSLESTGGTASISRTPLSGVPMLTISSLQDLESLMATFVPITKTAEKKEEEVSAEAARLIRLDAYNAVGRQEAVEGRESSADRKKTVENLAKLAIEKIGALGMAEAQKLSMAGISVGTQAVEKFNTVTDFLIWAESELGQVIGKADPATMTGDERSRMADAMYYFVLARLANKQASGVDWYLSAVQAAMAIVHNVHPELKADKDLERLYKSLIAVTSQGQRVEMNFIFGDSVYRYFREHGRLPDMVSFGGKSKPQIQNNLVKLQNLIDSRGIKAAMDFLEQRKTAAEVNALYDEVLPNAEKKNAKLVSGELADTYVRGAMLLGPKIGSFFGNLQFLFDSVTMDLWFTRTVQRIIGRPFGINIGEYKGPRGKALPEHGRMVEYTGFKGSLQRMLFALEQKQQQAEKATPEEKLDLQEKLVLLEKSYTALIADQKLSRKAGTGGTQAEIESARKDLKLKIYRATYDIGQLEWTEEDKAVIAEIRAFLDIPEGSIGNRRSGVEPLLSRTLAYAEGVHGPFAQTGYKLKTEFNRSSKGIDEALTKGLEAPSSGEYRNAVREVMDILKLKLKTDGIDLEHADNQAVLWYGEKDLYWMFGVADVAEGQDYAYSAAYLYAELLKGRQRDYNNLVGHTSISGDIEKFGTGVEESDEDEEDITETVVLNQNQVKRSRDPVLQEMAAQLKRGEITGEEYRVMADERMPLRESDEVPAPATNEEIAYGLGDRSVRSGEAVLKRDLIIAPEKIGSRIVESRLDIPAYDQRGVWIVSVHEDTGPIAEDFRGAGSPIGYTSAIHLNNVMFKTSQKAALNIAAGASKNTIATMRGENVSQTAEEIHALAVSVMSSPDWVEVGMNPIRSSMFYVKSTGKEVSRAAEIIQVGGVVLARGVSSDAAQARLYQNVWHGSPALFDQFSLRYVTQESGYGWGLYFTDNQTLAELYRKTKERNEIGELVSSSEKGWMYSVEIPDDNVLLDFNAPYSNQPEYIKQLLLGVKESNLDEYTKKQVALFRMGIVKSGASLYARLGGSTLLANGHIEGGDSEIASMTLRSLGIRGRRSFTDKGDSVFVMFDDAAVSIIKTMQQNQRDGTRGGISFAPGERGAQKRKFTMDFGKNADSSTFLHELMHYYLEAHGDIAADENAPEEIKKDMGIILEWWKRRPIAVRQKAVELAEWWSTSAADAIRAMSDSEIQNAINNWRDSTGANYYIGSACHELLAENWEAYLYEGKSPIPELQKMFHRIKQWFAKIYQDIIRIGDVDLSDDIKRVFDRIVASEVEINAAESREIVQPMFSEKPEGMPDAVWNQYKNSIESASLSAREKITAKLMESARAAETQERKDFRELTRAEVTDEFHAQKEYIALAILKTGKMPDGSELRPPIVAFKIDKESLLYEKSVDKAKMDALKRLGVYRVEGGISVEQAAEILGFNSAESLIDALVSTVPIDKAIKAEVKRREDASFPSLFDSRSATSDAASEAVRIGDRDKVIAAELAELSRLIRKDKAGMRRIAAMSPNPLGAIASRIMMGDSSEADAAIALLGSYELLRKLSSEAAENKLNAEMLRNIRPSVYASAARRDALKATRLAAAGKYVEALSAKESELLNTALFKKATEMREEADKQSRWLDSRSNPKAQARLGLAGHTYQDQMNSILERFNFVNIPLTEVARRASLAEWITQQEADGHTVSIDPLVLEEAFKTDYRNMTARELFAVYEIAKQIDHLAKVKLTIQTTREKREFAELINELVAKISADKRAKKAPTGTMSASEKTMLAIASGFASHRKLASLVRELDGLVEGGPMYWAVMARVNDAENAEMVQREAAIEKLQSLFDVYSREERVDMTKRKKALTSTGYADDLTLEDKLTMALNWGNESNRQRLVDGRSWQQRDVEEILGTLTKKDWDFVQSVLDFINSYWPEIEAKQKRVYGIAPEKVISSVMLTAYGPYAGGYYPLAYADAKGNLDNLSDAAKHMMRGASLAATTRRGHLKARLEHVERPVRLGFDVLTGHISQLIHDLTHHEMLIDTMRILRNREIMGAIEMYHGKEFVKTIASLMNSVAAGGTHVEEHGAQLFKYLRNGTQISVMGWNLMTSMNQIFGLTQAIPRVGAANLGKAALKWLTSAKVGENTVEWIYSKSSAMRLRGKTQDKELTDLKNTITPKRTTALMESYFYLIQKGQMLADVPIWLASYERAINSGWNETEAVMLADQEVIDTQGSGATKDLALVQQGSTFQKLFTMFYSYFSATYNLNAETVKGMHWANKVEFGRGMVDLLILNSLPVAVNMLVLAAVGKGGNPDELFKDFVKNQFGFLMNQTLFSRELAGMLEGRTYEGPAGMRPIADIYQLAKAISQDIANDEVSRHTIAQANKVLGGLLWYPAIFTQRFIEGAKALWEGRTQNPLVLARGPTKEERGD